MGRVRSVRGSPPRLRGTTSFGFPHNLSLAAPLGTGGPWFKRPAPPGTTKSDSRTGRGWVPLGFSNGSPWAPSRTGVVVPAGGPRAKTIAREPRY